MFGREHGAATSRTGLKRLGEDAPRHPSRDEDGPIDGKTNRHMQSKDQRGYAGFVPGQPIKSDPEAC